MDSWPLKDEACYNWVGANMDQFELAEIPLQQAGVDERLHLK